MEYQHTAEWWNSESLIAGKRNAELYPWQLVQLYGGVTKRGWADRRSRAESKFPGVDFTELEKGCNAGKEPEERQEAVTNSVAIHSDGSQTSDKLVRMSETQRKDPTFLLEAHGFDPNEWEVVNAKSSVWHGYAKDAEGDLQTTQLYSSKLTVKPRVVTWCMDDLVAAFRDTCTPIKVKQPKTGEALLELGYTDAHFGNSTIECYRDTIARSIRLIEAKRWKRVLIWTGSDYFHCDNFKNTTSHGTPQSSVWWPDAYRDGLTFIGTIIEAALKNASEVHVAYIPGNHDESMAWMFANLLQERYPQVIHDTAIEERKVHVFGECAIGLTHGDEKTRKDLDRIFAAEFRQFSGALHKEVHMGHLHHESTKDNYGVTSRSLPTRTRTDKWHREEGFVGANKRFQVFEWDEFDGVTDIHYV